MDTYIHQMRLETELEDSGFSKEDARKFSHWLRDKDYCVVTYSYVSSVTSMENGIKDVMKHIKKIKRDR